MIIHERKAIFVHVPKTAGVSITHAVLSSVLGMRTTGQIKRLPLYIAERFSLDGKKRHRPAGDYVPKLISADLWAQYYKFALCRNPFDWVVSHFCYRKGCGYKGSFADFLTHCYYRVWKPSKRRKAAPGPPVYPQKRFVAVDGKQLVNDVFRFEQINDALPKIEEMTGIRLSLERANRSKRTDWQSYYSDVTERMVRNCYAEDFEFFGY